MGFLKTLGGMINDYEEEIIGSYVKKYNYYEKSDLIELIKNEDKKYIDYDIGKVSQNKRDVGKVYAAEYLLISKFKMLQDEVIDLRYMCEYGTVTSRYNARGAIDAAVDDEIDMISDKNESEILDIAKKYKNKNGYPYKKMALVTVLVMKFDYKCQDAMDLCLGGKIGEVCSGKFYTYGHIEQKLQEPKEESGCYITTAVCTSFDKTDDCYELTMFRDFRDNYLLQKNNGKILISQYYETAPQIVDCINKHNNASVIYKKIWDEYLAKCLSYIEDEKMEECESLYIKMVEKLTKQYLKKKE